MGKLRSKKAKSKAAAAVKSKESDSPPERPEPSPFSQLLPKDFDLTSVKSFKSLKNKFGLKKAIKKGDKLKLRKEMLKQKIDYIKEIVEDKKTTKSKKKKAAKQSGVEIKPFKRDEDEEYVKLENKRKKGIQKQKNRQKEAINNVNALKKLMFKK